MGGACLRIESTDRGVYVLGISSAQLASLALQMLSAADFSASASFCASTLASLVAIAFSFSPTEKVAASTAAFASASAAVAATAYMHTR